MRLLRRIREEKVRESIKRIEGRYREFEEVVKKMTVPPPPPPPLPPPLPP